MCQGFRYFFRKLYIQITIKYLTNDIKLWFTGTHDHIVCININVNLWVKTDGKHFVKLSFYISRLFIIWVNLLNKVTFIHTSVQLSDWIVRSGSTIPFQSYSKSFNVPQIASLCGWHGLKTMDCSSQIVHCMQESVLSSNQLSSRHGGRWPFIEVTNSASDKYAKFMYVVSETLVNDGHGGRI